MVKIGVVGYGYWGKNLVRNFSQLKEVQIVCVADKNSKNIDLLRVNHPGINSTQDMMDIIKDPGIDAVVVATPAISHFEVAKLCLENKKHVFVEKPLALTVEDGEELVRLSRKNKRIMMVGHLMEYHPAVRKLKEYIVNGDLGEIYYLYSQRVNLGKVRIDENALWSLAPHDISMILFLLDSYPEEVSATGESYLNKKIEDVIFFTLRFPSRIIAHIHVSWLDPDKIRKLTVVGSRKMAVFDDMSLHEKIKIFDKGVPSHDALSLRFGDIHIPALDASEPLKNECQHFIECIREGREPLSNGADGLRVLKILCMAQKSLKAGGKPFRLS